MRGTIIVRLENTTDEELVELKKSVKDLVKDKEGVTVESTTTG